MRFLVKVVSHSYNMHIMRIRFLTLNWIIRCIRLTTVVLPYAVPLQSAGDGFGIRIDKMFHSQTQDQAPPVLTSWNIPCTVGTLCRYLYTHAMYDTLVQKGFTIESFLSSRLLKLICKYTRALGSAIKIRDSNNHPGDGKLGSVITYRTIPQPMDTPMDGKIG